MSKVPSAGTRAAHLLAILAPFLLESPNFIPKPGRLDIVFTGDGSVQLLLELLQRIYNGTRLGGNRDVVVHGLFSLPVASFFNLPAPVPLCKVVEVGFTGLQFDGSDFERVKIPTAGKQLSLMPVVCRSRTAVGVSPKGLYAGRLASILGIGQ